MNSVENIELNNVLVLAQIVQEELIKWQPSCDDYKTLCDKVKGGIMRRYKGKMNPQILDTFITFERSVLYKGYMLMC